MAANTEIIMQWCPNCALIHENPSPYTMPFPRCTTRPLITCLQCGCPGHGWQFCFNFHTVLASFEAVQYHIAMSIRYPVRAQSTARVSKNEVVRDTILKNTAEKDTRPVSFPSIAAGARSKSKEKPKEDYKQARRISWADAQSMRKRKSAEEHAALSTPVQTPVTDPVSILLKEAHMRTDGKHISWWDDAQSIPKSMSTGDINAAGMIDI